MNHLHGADSKVITLNTGLNNIRFPILNEVEAYWEGLRNGRLLPSRAQVDPRGLERALSYAFVAERIAPRVARFRVAGQHLTALMGMEVRGMPLTALFAPPARDEVSDTLEQLFEGPAVARISLLGEGGLHKPALTGGMLLLPLRNDQGKVSRLLGCLCTDGQIGRTPRRFTVTSSTCRLLDRLGPAPFSAPQTLSPGLAEPAQPFQAAPTPRAKGRPVLRIVRSDD